MTEELWNKILQDLESNPRDLQTIPLRGNGIWFYASIRENVIVVENARTHKPSSNLAAPRTITQREFERMYPIYIRRRHGEQVSNEARRASRNQVYIYSIFANCGRI